MGAGFGFRSSGFKCVVERMCAKQQPIIVAVKILCPAARAELMTDSIGLGPCTGRPQGPNAPPTALMTRSVCCLTGYV